MTVKKTVQNYKSLTNNIGRNLNRWNISEHINGKLNANKQDSYIHNSLDIGTHPFIDEIHI